MDALKRFFNKLEFDGEDNFNNVKVERCVVNKEKETWDLYLNSPNVLPLEPVLSLIEKAKKGIKGVNQININFSYENLNADDILIYVKYYIEKLIKKSPSLISLKENEIILGGEKIIFEVTSTIEAGRIKDYSLKITKWLSSLGLKDFVIETSLNNEKRNKIKEEIENTKEVIIVNDQPKFKIIMGEEIKSKTITIKEILGEENNVTIEAYIFGIEEFISTKSNFKILTLKISDKTDSMIAKIFTKEDDFFNNLKKNLKVGSWYKFKGYTKNDMYAKDLVLNLRDIVEIASKDIIREDNAKDKRVELHAHTMMSKMDGVVSPKDLIKQAIKWGHKAIAITDKHGAQAFPEVFNIVKGHNKGIQSEADKFKAIYGTELILIDDSINIIRNPIDKEIESNLYCVFDVETTGFNAGGEDSIIEIGGVLLQNGEIIDTFAELINPGRPLPSKITEITNITDAMLKDKDSEEPAVKRFIKWFKDATLVAHNAKFDMSFLDMAVEKYKLNKIDNPVIDTLELSRSLDPDQFRHSLSALVKRYEIEFDEAAHHRADYDADATAKILVKLLKKVERHNITNLKDLNNLVPKDEIHKFGRSFHVNILAKDRVGLKNLFKLISYANTKYLYKTPRILRSEIEKHREGLLIGSGCAESEVFTSARSKTEEELAGIINFYDYVEVQPLEVYDYLLQQEVFSNIIELENNIKKVINTTIETGKLIIATGDVHHLHPEDKIYREVIINQKVPGGGIHPLSRSNITNIPSTHFRTTDEMLADFAYLGKDLAKLLVIDNPNKIADMISHVDVIIDTKGVPFSPKIPNSAEEVTRLVNERARVIYGDDIHPIILDRIDKELAGIIGNHYDVIYLISQKLVQKSNEDGYLVGSRGSVGSSVIAFFMGISEVNSLPVHYVCPKCKHTTFEDENGTDLSNIYSSGYDLPDKTCSCGEVYTKDGHNIPFSSFLGYNADKVPDIDLNFSGEYQPKAHAYTKVLLGENNVFRAGTISTVAEKTAYGFVKGYCEDKGIMLKNIEIERLALGVTGVKRSTGQHPGGIVVIPDYMDVFDFTPYQYPADDVNSLWKTTHFDYHPMEDEILKLDILGHDDPTTLRMLQDLSGIDILTLKPFDDPKILSLLTSPEALGVTADQINCNTGTLGLPELGTKFVQSMLADTKPKTFGGLVKISGLSHGTGVWAGNAKDLIENEIATFDEIIGCREELITKLMAYGMDGTTAFKTTEFVRKSYAGRASKLANPRWQPFKEELIKPEYNIPDWFIESVETIEYMFPKAHATAYVTSALRIAWFKVYQPLIYYCAYFSIRCYAFEVDTLIKGENGIRNRIVELESKGYEITNKELDILDTLYSALEMVVRGYTFKNIDLEKSAAKNFIITEEKDALIIPFSALDGLGENAAKQVIKERELNRFISIEDVQIRGKINSTTIDKMRNLGVFKNMPESSQLSFFD
ncbi:MAG: PolC-type DNA polymerase III [Bacilli bacterium]|nr:PolC-type DNA polymerase III [Bacilli bacterium]